MKSELKLLTGCITLMLFLNFNPVNAQILSDTASFNLIEKCVDNIYNFQFAEARKLCNKINQKYPGHSGVYLLRGMITYWENYPLLPKSAAIKSYLDYMHLSIRLSEKRNNASREPENLLINLCARGMLLLFYSENDFSSEVIPLATSTYPHIRRSFNFVSAYYDFNFFTGLYNYYREAYPEVYPIYKTFIFLFPKGNMDEGLRELQTAGRCSLVLKAESYAFLSWIYTNFERDFVIATSYSRMLYELYPDNPQYWTSYIKNLLLIKRYDEAEMLMNSPVPATKNTFILAKLGIFNAILQEKKYHNPDLAFTMYEKGVKDISSFQSYGNEFTAYAYFGLSRISDMRGDKNYMKCYQKKAIDLAVFENVDFND